jgi:hypothetical protein
MLNMSVTLPIPVAREITASKVEAGFFSSDRVA